MRITYENHIWLCFSWHCFYIAQWALPWLEYSSSIGCIGMVASSGSLWAVWAGSDQPLTSRCILIWIDGVLGPDMPFAAEVACGQVTVSHLAHPRVALNLDYMFVSGKRIDACPIAGRFFRSLMDWNHLELGHCEWRSTQRKSVRAVQGTTNLFI